MDDILYNYLVHTCGAANVRQNEPLSRWTTFRVGGPARYFVTVTDKATLPKVISALTYLEFPYFVLGCGANVLASDQGYHGVIIKLAFREIYHNDQFIYADAGAYLGAVVNYAQAHGLTGLEWAAGIPATIGGACYMNCGAFGKSMQDVVVMVDVLDHGTVKTLTADQLAFGYRHSVFQGQPWVILGAYLHLTPGDPAQIATTMREIILKRSHHPKEPSAGSTFKRPRDGFYVGKVIEELGLKNYQIGGAKVSEKHCGFVVNAGNATAQDILQVIYHIQDVVEKATHTVLETEVIFLGEI